MQATATHTLSVQLLSDTAQLPRRAHPADAGLDLCAAEAHTLAPQARALIGTGIAVEIAPGSVGLVHPRSGLAVKHGITVLNAPGTIDAGYRGEIRVALINHSDEPFDINIGDRIAQLLIQEVALPDVIEVTELSDAARGDAGFGSTGR